MGKLNEGIWDERREVLRRLSGSGLSAAEFCRREKLDYGKLMTWRKRIREMDGVASKRRKPHSAPVFAELVLRDDDAKNVRDPARPEVEILLRGGALVRIYAGADSKVIRSIVEAAGSC
jgi:hypothetical protein